MNSVVCTLFEGNYHYGVAALVNSLYAQGFRGRVYIGYRGKLPLWSSAAIEEKGQVGNCILKVEEGLQLHFLLLDTKYHFSNYKPDFMLQLWNGLAQDADAMFYFDPDIVVATPWTVFEEWIKCGVALCEDVNSPLARNHPTRIAWRQYFNPKGFALQFKEAIYANGGFIGVTRQNRSFVTTWQAIQEAMAPAIGGLGYSSFTGVRHPLPFAPFGKTDQDALNATVEAWEEGAISFVGKEGMAFKLAMPLMSHAIGGGKPWMLQYLVEAVKGQSPRRSDRDYWQFANGPIVAQPRSLVKRKQFAINAAALLGRFYSRGR